MSEFTDTKIPPVIGVGASAGGLEAFQQFLSAAKPDHGLAYVLIQHLDPTHESLLPELLSKKCRLPVAPIAGGELVQADHVYLIPPNAELTIEDGILRLSQFEEPRGQRRPIDTFFRSLAQDQKTNAACIVLSGTGADGSEGLRVMKAEGGLTIAQDPALAKYSGMPSSAVTTGLVDLVLSPEEMPNLLARYFDGVDIRNAEDIGQDSEFFNLFTRAIRARTGYDFSQYRRTSILRRVARRMQVLGVKTERDYVEKILSRPHEADRLFNDILINVTKFFRDSDHFEQLRQIALPQILNEKTAEDTVRIWIPGCSSGEEAYSIAIMLDQYLSTFASRPEFDIFATDIDSAMITKAKDGVYPHSSIAELPPEIVDTYFEQTPEGFRVIPRIQSRIRFSKHSLIKDPPFSKLDLISCRNLLIYFESSLQARVIPIFHYALKPGGFLFLGPSENISDHADLFVPRDKAARIFERAPGKTPLISFPLSLDGEDYRSSGKSFEIDPPVNKETVEKQVVARHLPPHVVTTATGEIRYVSAGTSRYLEFDAGVPVSSIQQMAKEGLKGAISSLLENTVKGVGTRRKATGIPFEDDGEIFQADIFAEQYEGTQVLFIFRQGQLLDEETDFAAFGDEVDNIAYDQRIKTLERELSSAEQELRTTIEELETSNEELKSSNEEMMSMNEELQSANEELTTVNDELNDKIGELGKAHSDISNFLQSTSIMVVFLDDDYRIRSFTPAAKTIFRFKEHDEGRPLTDISSDIDFEDLLPLLDNVKSHHHPVEAELQDSRERYFATRALPYRNKEHNMDGLVVTFTDITELKRINGELEAARRDAQRQYDEVREIYRTAPQAMALIGSDRTFIRVNDKLAEIDGVPVVKHIGRRIDEILPDLAPLVDPIIERVFKSGEAITDFDVSGESPGSDGEIRTWQADYYPVSEGEDVVAVGICVRDVTQRNELEENLQRVMRELQHRVKNMLANVKSLVRQAERSGEDPAKAFKTLSDRISSLARTHDLLTRIGWKETTLETLAQMELVNIYGEAVEVRGPKVQLGSRATLALSMAIHELATNASKYGAFSTPEGRLSFRWKLEDDGSGDMLHISWVEDKGPPVSVPERKRGFGSTLIQASIERTLDGKYSESFEPSGFRCAMVIPVVSLQGGQNHESGESRKVQDPFH